MKRPNPATILAVLITALPMRSLHAATVDEVDACAAFGRLAAIIMERRLDGASPSEAINGAAPEYSLFTPARRRLMVLDIYDWHIPLGLEIKHDQGDAGAKSKIVTMVRNGAEIICFESLE
ncbi:hypothetical protein AB3X55_03250 [Alphaproteobacteria bacterium LSUCC0719]